MTTNGHRIVALTAPLAVPKMALEMIGPDQAATLLGTAIGNRTLKARKVKQFAREMLAGKWLVNGEGIIVSRSGRLIDGSHRLNAVIMAGVSVPMLVVRGVADEVAKTVNTGTARTYGDHQVISGRAYAQKTGPITNWWYRYELGSPASNITPSFQELDQLQEQHPQIVESAAFIANRKTLNRRCVPSVQGFVHAYTTEKYDRDMADLFMQMLNDGIDLTATNPIHALRRRLVDEESSRGVPIHVLAWTIKAWNFWIDGRPLEKVLWRTGGANPEDFPRFTVDGESPGRARTLEASAKSNKARAAARRIAS